MNTYFITTHAIIAVTAWWIFSIGTGFACFSRTIRDTLSERVFLGCMCITAFATGCRIINQGWITEGGMLLACSCAGYIVSIAFKHWREYRTGFRTPMPKDKSRPLPLSPEISQ